MCGLIVLKNKYKLIDQLLLIIIAIRATKEAKPDDHHDMLYARHARFH